MTNKQRSRVMLIIIAIFATFGGAYAFRANRAVDIVFTRSTAATTICDALVRQRTTDPTGQFVTSIYATTSKGAVCTISIPVYVGG